MKPLELSLTFVALFGEKKFAAAEIETHIHDVQQQKTEADVGECEVYLAESSIPNAGLGVFAGRDFQLGERIGHPGIGIQVIDPDAIYDANELISEFGWNSLAVGGSCEADSVFTALPGLGMLANFHPTLSNVIPGGLTDEPLLNRGVHPGAGSSTSYGNFTFIASANITVGQELFAAVGDGWFTHYYDQEEREVSLPLGSDYESADAVVKKLAEFKNNHSDVTEAQFLDILYRMKNEIIQDNEKLQKLIPNTIEGLLDAANRGTARSLLNDRHIDWLKSNGKCLDNIRSGSSTISDAGRGAFATRFIPKGSIVAPAPLVQVMNKQTFEVDLQDMDNSTQQLLLNYCFGHRKSSLLLCPTTSVVLINHDRDNSNAEFRWSPPSGNRLDSDINYRMESLDELQADTDKISTLNSRLMFDFVATRDIHPGEEVFIDYGEEWTVAWEKHVKKWKSHENSRTFVPASTMNAENRPILLMDDPELIHHSYLCRLELFAREEMVENMPEEDFHANPAVDPNFWDEKSYQLYADNSFLTWWPCDVFASDTESGTFSAEVYSKTSNERGEYFVIRRLKNVPRDAIKFVDRPYHSDQHAPNAFRHYIPIPDAMFPLRWRDDYTSADSVRLGMTNAGVDLFREENREQMREYERGLREAKCGVYVAPSNIPNAGMGTYVGYTSPGKGLPLGSRVPAFPVADFASDKWDANDYVWSSSAFSAEYEGREGSTSILAVNEGCMANFHPGLVNHETSNIEYSPVLDRCKDPGAGAFSDYIDFSFNSAHEVRAGEEAFISYGEHWFSSRSYLGTVPLSANYLEANRIVASLASLTSSEDSKLSDQEVTALLRLVKDEVVVDVGTGAVLERLKTVGDLRRIMSRNGTAEATTELRSLEWLETYGNCIDHIYSKDSTIKQAGKGAFARRFIKNGSIIISSPLLLTWGRELFDMNATHVPTDINRKQLIYNYQFAHPDSSVLFFPVNTAVTINHQSARRPSGIPPNAEIRWSASDKKSAYYRQRHLDDLKEQHYAIMIFDIVATRDIKPDEEIFLDYGEEWENAWDEHVNNFVSPCHQGDPSSRFQSSKRVKSMNGDKFNPAYHPWSGDHFTVCAETEMPRETENLIRLMPEGSDIEHIKDVETYTTSFREINYYDEGFDLTENSELRIPCKILRADAEDEVFDVVYFTAEQSSVAELEEAKYLRRKRTLPAEHLEFINKPYKSDMFWSGSFRHEIMIPDSIFPPLWKDLLSKNE